MNDQNAALMDVSFACQRCCQPLKFHNTLNTVNHQILNELSATNATNINTDHHSNQATNSVVDNASNVVHKVVPSVRFARELSTNGNGFIVITDSTSSLTPSLSNIALINSGDKCASSGGGSRKLSEHMKICSELFDILSDQSDVDHPLCEECADFVIDQMDHQLTVLEEECRDYREYLESIQSQKDCDSEESQQTEIDELRQKLENLQVIEKQLLQELNEVNREKAKVDEEVSKQSEELQRLYTEEDKYWYEYNNMRNNLFVCDDEQQSIDNQVRYAQTHLDKLKRTNVFNATFHIWHSGQFGTINNFRLGRLPTVQIEWSEVNAAWGQCALLLHSLANKMNFTFQRYKIVPYGNHSFLESLDDNTRELPLYATAGFRYFWNNKFDQAMVAFLDCLQQFKEEVESGDSQFYLPYKMEKGKIEDPKTGNSYSIKIQFNSEEQWTKALKYMLTNLKWALAWVSSQFSSKT